MRISKPTARRPAALALSACFALCLSACSSTPAGHRREGTSPPRPDLAALQGQWEQLPAEPGGPGAPRQRVVKDVSGNVETVTTYGPRGEVVRAQTATFKLSRSGPVRVYTVQNPKLTAGSGDATQSRLQFVYRVHGNEFDEVWGLLPGQEEREVVVKRWRRAGSGQ